MVEHINRDDISLNSKDAKVAYGCVTNSFERVQKYVLPRIGNRPLTLLWNQTSITQAYNQILNSWQSSNVDVIILLHDDLELIDPNAEEKFLHALADPMVGIAGVCGGFGVSGLAWWNAATVGHQLTDSGFLEFGPRGGVVDSIEGSVMAFGSWAIDNLRFDENFTGFHGYDDIGLEVTRKHKKHVMVVDVDTYHHTTFGFDSVESEQAWFDADTKFKRKWNLGVTSDSA
jgi:hypothetical protein